MATRQVTTQAVLSAAPVCTTFLVVQAERARRSNVVKSEDGVSWKTIKCSSKSRFEHSEALERLAGLCYDAPTSKRNACADERYLLTRQLVQRLGAGQRAYYLIISFEVPV